LPDENTEHTTGTSRDWPDGLVFVSP
jgi:hypothetical protein